MKTIAERLQAVCEDGDVHFHAAYSGRFMYGKTCVAISGPYQLCQQAIAIVTSGLMTEMFDAAVEFATNLGGSSRDALDDMHATAHKQLEHMADQRIDDLGLGKVVYFPMITADAGEQQ